MIKIEYVEYTRGNKIIYGWKCNGEWYIGGFVKDKP